MVVYDYTRSNSFIERRIMDLTIKVDDNKKGCVLIELIGDMDAYTSPQFKIVVEDLIKREEYQLIADLEKVTCIDSVGAGMLLAGLKMTKDHGGNLWLIYNKSKVKKFLEVTGLNKNFVVCKDKRQAYQVLKTGESGKRECVIR